MIGRSGRDWTLQAFQLRPGHLRPNDGAQPHQVDLVHDEPGYTFGALRRFSSHRDRADVLALLGTAGPAGPALLDLVDLAESPPAIVTAWAPGRSAAPLSQLVEPDDLLAQLQQGRRWTPAAALRLLVPLGAALDRFAVRGFVPLELSPDHLIENGGGIRLVGWGRHLYQPGKGTLPDSAGMSLPTTQMLCGEMPGPDADFAQWRQAQLRMLLRLAGWMCGGLPPGSWGTMTGARQQEAYLQASGFASAPRLEPGRLADTLAAATAAERAAEARQRVQRAARVVLFDGTPGGSTLETREAWQQSLLGQALQATVTETDSNRVRVRVGPDRSSEWLFYVYWQDTPYADRRDTERVDLTRWYSPGDTVTVLISDFRPISARITAGAGEVAWGRRRLEEARVNPEAVRLGLLAEHGPDVLAVAALPASRQTSQLAALLSGAGWLMIDQSRFPDVLRSVAQLAPAARIVVAGRPGRLLASALPADHEEVIPGAAGPQIAGRSPGALPYLADPDLNAYYTEVLHNQGGAALRRRTFAAGWAIALDDEAFQARQARALRNRGSQLITELEELNALFGSDTELLLRVIEMRERPGLRDENWLQMKTRLREAAPVLLHMPSAGALRNDLMHALLRRSIDSLYSDVTRRLLPVAPRLAQVYQPQLQLGDETLQQLLYTREGVRRLGLLGRLVTAVPLYSVQSLLSAVSQLEQSLVDALLDVPAPSLQFLVGRLGSAELFSALQPFIDGPDLDLLGQYTPTAWRLLLEGLRQPEHLAALGLGWTLVVERDRAGAVDARVLLEIARQAQLDEARYAVRALLDVPASQWSRLLAEPAVAAAWLRAFGRLDAAPVLDAFPDATRLLRRFSPQALRAAALGGLDSGTLASVDQFATGTGLEAGDVVTTFLNIGAEAGDAAIFANPAAAGWGLVQLAAGAALDDVMADLIEAPALLRSWLINGDDLPGRVLSGVLGTDPLSLQVHPEEGGQLVALLEEQPALLGLARDLVFPSQRLRLLRLALAHPEWSLASGPVRDALPSLLDAPDTEDALALMLGEQLSYRQARIALDRQLDPAGLALLRALGPLASGNDSFTVAARYGVPLARDVTVLEQTRPGATSVILSWGSRWLPLLAGPDGGRIAALLSQFGNPGAAVSVWLRAAGEDGLTELGRHGQDFLTLVDQVAPHPADAKLLGQLLRLGGDATAYRLIVAHGVPYQHWPVVIAGSHRSPEDILLALWSADGWPDPVRAAT